MTPEKMDVIKKEMKKTDDGIKLRWPTYKETAIGIFIFVAGCYIGYMVV